MKMQSLQNHEYDLKIKSLTDTSFINYNFPIRVTQLFLEIWHLRGTASATEKGGVGSRVHGGCVTAPRHLLREQPQQKRRHTAVRGTLKEGVRDPYTKILPSLKEMESLDSSNITQHGD